MPYTPLPTTPSVHSMDQKLQQVLQDAKRASEAEVSPAFNQASPSSNSTVRRHDSGVLHASESSSNPSSSQDSTTITVHEDETTVHSDGTPSPKLQAAPCSRRSLRKFLATRELQQVAHRRTVYRDAVPLLSSLLGAPFTNYTVTAPPRLARRKRSHNQEQLVAAHQEAAEPPRAASLIVRLKIRSDKLSRLCDQQPERASLKPQVKRRRVAGQARKGRQGQISTKGSVRKPGSEGLQGTLSQASSSKRRATEKKKVNHTYETRSRGRATEPGEVMTSTHPNVHRASSFDETFRIDGNVLPLGMFVTIPLPSQDTGKEGPKAAWRRLFPGEGELPDTWRERLKFTGEGEWVARAPGDEFVPVRLNVSRDVRWEGRY